MVVGGGEIEGYSDGYEEGKEIGYDTGSDEGYQEGEPEGYDNGLETGYTEGEIAGFEEGRELGYPVGEEEGYTAGESTGYKSGKEQGYSSGYSSGFDESIGSDALVYNPTYQLVKDMLSKSAATSAVTISDDFEAERIRSGYVWVKYVNGRGLGREFVAFETIDKGIIIIDPRSKREVELEVGESMSQLLGNSAPDYDDTILSVTITW